MVTAALIIVTLLFSLYLWISEIEFALGLMRLYPSLPFKDRQQHLLSPVLELSNIFLFFSFVILSFFFNTGVSRLFHQFGSILSTGLILIAIRIALVFYIKQAKVHKGFTVANVAFSVVSFLIPLLFGVMGTYQLTGENFWQSTLGWTFFAMSFLGIFLFAFSFLYFLSGTKTKSALRKVTRIFAILFYVVSSLVLEPLINARLPHIINVPYIVFSLLCMFVLLWVAAFWWDQKHEYYLWAYVSVVTLLGPILLMLANRPYFIFPSLYLDDASTINTYSTDTTFSHFMVILLLAIGVLVLWKFLLFTPTKKHPSLITKKNRS